MMANKVQANKKDNGELRKKIEYQVACEERAHRIVERLIYNPVTQEKFINALHFITPSHYSDIIEERAVSKLCGYPLCPNDLTYIPKQKYVISTKTNKVYDIEARKNFCSSQCYKASKHLECQVSSDPVWSRKHIRPTVYDFLPLDTKCGKVGDEVIVSKAGEIKEDLKRLEKLEKYQKNLAERIHEHNLETEKERMMQMPEKIDKDNESDVKENISEKDKEVNDNLKADIVTYTLDKAMGELSIETYDNEETEPTENDKEQSHGHANKGYNAGTKNNSIDTVINDKASNQGTVNLELKKSSELKSLKKNKEVNPSKAKTEYLMQLLDKRKALLGKMADIQNEENAVSTVSKLGGKSDNVVDETASIRKAKVELDSENIDRKAASVNRTTGDIADKPDKVSKKEISEVGDTKIKDVQVHNVAKTAEKSYCKSKVEKRKGKEHGHNIADDDQKKTKTLSALDLIGRGVRSWITDKTIEYLNVDDGEIGVENTANSVFEKQYKALVAKVDAQEKDFDGLLGEETMDPDDIDKPSAPLPHFEVLRQELEEDQIRVREFMKGSFTYKVQEKQTLKKEDGSNKVVLPTVNRYDQLLIRQKIVLGRINKILPDLLPPLHLLVQDIFTELKELIFTFNLTSDNILFKPAEWTVVTLILLRMLSKKMMSVRRSFTSPGAEKYFIVLLSSIGASIEGVDVVVNNLLTLESK